MKKLISVVALTLVMVTMLAACGKFTCDLCGEEKSGKKYEKKIFGEEIVYCKDCKDAVQELMSW